MWTCGGSQSTCRLSGHPASLSQSKWFSQRIRLTFRLDFYQLDKRTNRFSPLSWFDARRGSYITSCEYFIFFRKTTKEKSATEQIKDARDGNSGCRSKMYSLSWGRSSSRRHRSEKGKKYSECDGSKRFWLLNFRSFNPNWKKLHRSSWKQTDFYFEMSFAD